MIADLYRLRWFPQAAMRLRGGVSDGPRSPKRNYGPRGSSSPRGMPSLAHAGEPQPGDWRCPPCGMSNYRRRIACFRCGTLRDSNVASVVTSPMRQDSPNRGGPSRLGFLPEDMERGRQIAFKEARRSMVRVSFTLNLWVRRFATVFRFATVRCAIARNIRPLGTLAHIEEQLWIGLKRRNPPASHADIDSNARRLFSPLNGGKRKRISCAS